MKDRLSPSVNVNVPMSAPAWAGEMAQQLRAQGEIGLVSQSKYKGGHQKNEISTIYKNFISDAPFFTVRTSCMHF